MKLKLAMISLVILAVGAPLFATNGYFTHGQGTTNKALGGAGAALPQDPLATMANPAGLAFLPNEYFLSLSLFNPNRSYNIKGNPSGYQGTFGLTPGEVSSESEYFLMPSLAGSWTPTDRSALSVSFVSHGGMNTDYRTNTFYGGSHTGVDLAQMFLNTTYAHKLGENHALGFTAIVAYQRFEAQGLQAFGQMSSDPQALTNNEHDSSYGFGARVGYLGNLTPNFSVGGSYSPKIEMSKFDDYAGLFCDSGSFDIPSSATVGVAYKIAPVTLLFDAQQIYYSEVDAVGHPFANMMQAPLGAEGGAGFGWEDITVYKAGVQWDQNDDWTWRAGYSKGDQPIPSSEVLFNILAPGVIEEHVTFGFSKTMLGASRLNLALMYALENTVVGANPMEAPGQQQIELTMDEWELELSYSMRF